MLAPRTSKRTSMPNATAMFGTVLDRLVGSSAAILFFASVGEYTFSSGLSPLPPFYLAIPFIAFAGGAALLRRPSSFAIDWPLATWASVYLLVSMASSIVAADPDQASDVLQRRFLSVAFLLAMRTIMGNREAYISTRATVATATVFAVGLNAYEWLFPLSFSFSYGRAAGLYINPNISGSALVIGMVIGLNALPRAWREPFIVVVGLGVLLTFSRGALIGWAVAVSVLLAVKSIRVRRVTAICGLAVVALSAVAGQSWFRAVSGELATNRPELLSRIGMQGLQADGNTESRLALASAGLNAFAHHPILGSGLGETTNTGSAQEGSHNLYVTHLAEHGVLGALLFPSLLVLLALRAQANEQRAEIALVVFLGIWGLFSHNVLDEFHSLLAIGVALAAAVPKSNAAYIRKPTFMRTGMAPRERAPSESLPSLIP